MSKNSIKVTPDFIQNLKEEHLQDLRELENKLVDQVNKKWCQIQDNNNSILERVTLMSDNNKEMFDSLTLQKIKIDKISDYEPFKNKIEAMVTTHEIRINSIISDVLNLRTKYDKIISDNLTVPGFIGPACQFKSISDFLLNRIMEISKTKNEKEQIKSDVKECKIRVEGFVKNMVNLCDNSVLRCNEYTDNKEKNMKEYIKNSLENFEKKNLDMRAGLYDKQQKMFEQLQNDMKEFDELLMMKKDINQALESKLKEYEKKFVKMNEKIDEKEKEIRNLTKELKQSYKHINDMKLTIKEILFKETSNQMDIIKINSKFKKFNFIENPNNVNNINSNNNNNTIETNNTIINDNINNNLNTDNITTINSINNDNYINKKNSPPTKNAKIPNTGINLFKESILKGKTLINRKKGDLFKDDLFRIKKNDSKKFVLFNEQEKRDNEENSDEENENKLYEQINFKRYVTSNEISYSITNNNLINNKNNNNDISITSIKNKILKNNINITETNLNKDKKENKKVSFSRNNIKSDYKPKNKNQKYLNLLKKNNMINEKNIVFDKLNSLPNDNSKKYRTLKSDVFINCASKISKGFNIKALIQNNNVNNKKFNYKVVSLGDKVSLDGDSKELYSLDFETLKKRTIRLNLVSPLSKTLKIYQNEKNKQNTNNELNIKVSPAFGSTAYSFYQKKDFSDFNHKSPYDI